MISVLMPAYNAEKYISIAIESIINQTYQNWELLICDDFSTDRTYPIANSYDDPRIKLYKNRENRKKPFAVNLLFQHSIGDLITIHDADDISLPLRFQKIVQFFEKRKDIFMCGHDIERMNEQGVPLGLYRHKKIDYEQIKKDMENDNSDGDPSNFIRRDVLLGFNGEVLRSYFQNNMDYDLALRVIERYKSTNIPEVLSYYRNVANSISKNVPTFHKLVTKHITIHLAQQRKTTGRDALECGDWKTIRKLESYYSKPYILDKTLHFREMSSFFMYCKMYSTAVQYAWLAVRNEPIKLINWRTLQYCLRKALIAR